MLIVFFLFVNRSLLHGVFKANGWISFLKKKDGKHSLMDSFSLMIDDVDHVDEIQINGVNFDYDYPKFLLHLEDYSFNVEKWKSISKFLVLTKLDFNQERYLKKRFFGKEFENFDCPTLTKNYLWCVTMSHTFHYI